MSRFDLFFVLFDEKSPGDDFDIAQHIVNMHRLQAAHKLYSKEHL